jgi:hypothetical protein
VASVDAVDEALVGIWELVDTDTVGRTSAITVFVKTVVAVAVGIDLPETSNSKSLVELAPDFCKVAGSLHKSEIAIQSGRPCSFVPFSVTPSLICTRQTKTKRPGNGKTKICELLLLLRMLNNGAWMENGGKVRNGLVTRWRVSFQGVLSLVYLDYRERSHMNFCCLYSLP